MMIYCIKCGAPNKVESKFCASCGNPLAGEQSDRFEPTFGNMPNSEIMLHAKKALSGNWGLAIGALLVVQIIMNAPQYIHYFGGIGTLIIAGPIMVGVAIFSLSLSRLHDPRFEQIFHGFYKFGAALGAYILYSIFIFLWSLLLIIPGIIAALSYSQTFFIIAEDNAIGPYEAIKKSSQIMNGHRWKYFCLNLRFIGWWLLCILTFGIGFLWFVPYLYVSYARFYDDVAR